MADACFHDYSALGSGDLAKYGNELTDAPEEEDFDVLNDETFGDIGNGDFDWEEQTEKFAEVLESQHIGDAINDSGFNTAEKSYRTQEEFMEHSINQLMVDDDEVDPAVLRAKPIPNPRQQNLDSLFGPASPPSFLDAEHLLSPTSKNIWGSPVQEMKFQKPPTPPVNTIQSLFDFAKLASTDTPVAHIHGPHSRSAPMMLPKAQTLEEIESSLLHKPKILTAEELERQLRGESPAQPTSSISVPNGHRVPPAQFTIPPPNIGSPQTRPLPPQMMAGSSPGMIPVMNGHRSPVFVAPGMPSTPVALPSTPRGVPIPAAHGTPMSIGGTPPYRNAATPLNRQSPASAAGRGYSQPIGIPHVMRGPPTNSPYNSSPQQQGMVGSPQIAYQSPQQHMQHHRLPHQGSFNNENNHNNRNNNNKYQSASMKGSYQQDQRQSSREHRYYRYPYNQKHEARSEHALHQYKRGSKDQDVYDGLMTQKEKDWIIKIQLLQLQTDNPYLDDYYYTSWCMKKKAKEREMEGGEPDPKLVIPAMARVENRAYKPAHFEGSLGRLTTSSVHNPRQIIDLLAKSMSEAAGGSKTTSNVGKELRKSRQLLMDIEKGYNLILVIDDLEKKILALPEDMRKPLLEERSYRIDLLFHYLLCDGESAAFMQYMNVRKGRMLTKRALPYLDKVQSVGIVSLVCKNLQQLMKKDQADERLEELFVPCAKVIETCNLATIVMFAEDIQQEDSPSATKPIAMALQNKFGSSILCALLHRGEGIYSTTSPVDLDCNLQDEWVEFVHDFAGILATIPLESVNPPIAVFPDVLEHLERILNKRLLAVVEDNIAIFTHKTLPSES